VGVTEGALRKGVADYEKEHGPPGEIPEGEKPGYIGRRPGVSSPPPRSIHSVNIDPSLRDSVHKVSYALRIKSESECLESISDGKGARPYFEFAIWFEKHLEVELNGLREKVGQWEVGSPTLRAGRRITKAATPKPEEKEAAAEVKPMATVKGTYDPETNSYSDNS
jgi:hypothetical protein